MMPNHLRYTMRGRWKYPGVWHAEAHPVSEGRRAGRKYQYVLSRHNGGVEVFRCSECAKEESRPAAEYLRVDRAVKQQANENKNITLTEVAKWCAGRDEFELGGKQIREAARRRRKHGAVVKKRR